MDAVYVSFEGKLRALFASSYTLVLNASTLLTSLHGIESIALSYKNKLNAECNFNFNVNKVQEDIILKIKLIDNTDVNSLCNKILLYGIYSKENNLISSSSDSLSIIKITKNTPGQFLEPIHLASVSTVEDYIYQHDSPLLLRLFICDPQFVAESLAGQIVDGHPSDCPTETESDIACMNNCNFVKDISHFYNSDSMSDVIISTKDKKFNAHKCILAARSSVLKEMLKQKLGKNENGKEFIPIEADNIVVEEMLRFIYTGQVEKLDELVSDLYEIGHTYNLQDLQETCVSYMNKNICIQNAMSLMLLARRHDLDTLLKAVIQFFVKHTDEILADDATSESLKPFFDIELSSSNFDL